jgi:hypothetical protein
LPASKVHHLASRRRACKSWRRIDGQIMRIRSLHLKCIGGERVDEFTPRSSIQIFEIRLRSRRKSMQQSLVRAWLDFAELSVRKSFGETADIGRKGSLIAVDRMIRQRLSALKRAASSRSWNASCWRVAPAGSSPAACRAPQTTPYSAGSVAEAQPPSVFSMPTLVRATNLVTTSSVSKLAIPPTATRQLPSP